MLPNKIQHLNELSPNANIISFLLKYKLQLIISLTVVFIVVFAILQFFKSSVESKNSAWFNFSEFRSKVYQNPDVSDDQINEFLQVVKNTSVEPWALFYISVLYYNQGDLESAISLINQIETRFDITFVAENPNLHQKATKFYLTEMQWRKINLKSST